MGKRRRHSVASTTTTSNSASGRDGRTTVVTREEKSSAHDILWPTLEALDGILDEAHQQMQHEEQQTTKSTQEEDTNMKDTNATVQRGSAVYAAMSRPHYNALSEAVMTYGSQLLPSLPDITRRVRLALQLPALSTVECWQTAALLCTYYGVGMSGMVSDLVEMAVRTSGLCLLALPQMHLPESCLALQHTSEEEGEESNNKAGVWHAANAEQRIWFTRATYKLEALREMLLSASALVPVRTLHKFATRFALEVIENGILSSLEALQTQEEDVSTFATPSNNTSTRSAKALHYRVPIELHAPCVRLLQAFLLLSPAPPAELRVCANRVVRELGADLHSGTTVLEETLVVDEKNNTDTSKSAKKNTNTKPVTKKSEAMVSVLAARRTLCAAVVELRQTLHVLHHPPTLPAYSPAHIVTERVTRRVWIDEANEASETKGEVEKKTKDDEECVPKTAAAALPTTTTTTTSVAMMSAASAVTTPSQPLIHTAVPQPTHHEKEEEEVVVVTKSSVTQTQTIVTTTAAANTVSSNKEEASQAVSEVMPSTTSTRQHATVEQTVQYEDDDDDDEDADFPEIDIED